MKSSVCLLLLFFALPAFGQPCYVAPTRFPGSVSRGGLIRLADMRNNRWRSNVSPDTPQLYRGTAGLICAKIIKRQINCNACRPGG
jgi:hypothetical protein